MDKGGYIVDLGNNSYIKHYNTWKGCSELDNPFFTG